MFFFFKDIYRKATYCARGLRYRHDCAVSAFAAFFANALAFSLVMAKHEVVFVPTIDIFVDDLQRGFEYVFFLNRLPAPSGALSLVVAERCGSYSTVHFQFFAGVSAFLTSLALVYHYRRDIVEDKLAEEVDGAIFDNSEDEDNVALAYGVKKL